MTFELIVFHLEIYSCYLKPWCQIVICILVRYYSFGRMNQTAVQVFCFHCKCQCTNLRGFVTGWVWCIMLKHYLVMLWP